MEGKWAETEGLFGDQRYVPGSEVVEKDVEAEKSAFLAKIKARAAKRKQIQRIENLAQPIPSPKKISKPKVSKPERKKIEHEPVIEDEPVVEEEQMEVEEPVEENEMLEEPVPGEEDFEILEDFQQARKPKIMPNFPRWCQKSVLIDSNFETLPSIDTIKDLIDETLFKNLKKLGYTELFPVQNAIIPELLKIGPSRDFAVQAPTGSGKTVAFLVPIIQQLINRAIPALRGLIVLPTRELAQQVHQVFQVLTKDTKLRSHLVVGQTSLANEFAKLSQKVGSRTYSSCDVIICTPGRLMDHLRAGLDLSRLRYLIIDEADRMSGDWLTNIDKSIDHNLIQKLLFSATLASDPQFLSAVKLKHPKLYTSGWTTPTGLTEEFVRVKSINEKPKVVKALLDEGKQTIIFTNSIAGASSLYTLLKEMGLNCEELSSNLEDWKRKNAIKKFKNGKLQAIVCSDIAARGLDFECCEMVISYDIAKVSAQHVHRSGRTARAGREGKSITIITLGNRTYKYMLKDIGRTYTKKIIKISE